MVVFGSEFRGDRQEAESMSEDIDIETIVSSLTQAFAKAEGNASLEWLHATKIEHYQLMKSAILSGQMGFEQAIAAAVSFHRQEEPDSLPHPSPGTETHSQDPYCYHGTDVLINKLNIRDKRALQEAETELSTIRMAELVFHTPKRTPPPRSPRPYPDRPTRAPGTTDPQIQKMLNTLNTFFRHD